VSADALQTCVTSRLMVIRGQAPTPISLSNKEASESRDALAKFIYGEHVVVRVGCGCPCVMSAVCRVFNLMMVMTLTLTLMRLACELVRVGALVPAANLFDWLVTRINKSIWGDAAASAQGSMKCIGILDIFGFGMTDADVWVR
jgi:hypothetical protein